MAEEFGLKLVGAEALQRSLAELPKAIASRVISKALAAGAKPVIAAARGYARGVSSGLAKSIVHKLAKKRYDHMRLLVLGPKEIEGLVDDRGRKKDYRNLAHLIEGGTASHEIDAKKGSKAFQGADKQRKKAMNVAAAMAGKKAYGQKVLGPMDTFAIEFASSVSHPGTAARPFMRPAFDGAGEAGIKAFMDKAVAEIEKEAAKLAAKTATV